MKYTTSFVIIIVLFSGAEALKCAEFLKNSSYNGSICTLANISASINTYNWSDITQKELHFVNSTIPFFPTGLQQSLANVEVLNMSNVRLQFVDFGDLQYAKNLKKIILSNNMLIKMVDYVFRDARKLEMLDLQNNLLGDIENFAFTGLSELKVLLLSNNSLKKVGQELNKLVNVELIDLRNNSIETIDPECILELKKIAKFNVENNEIQNFTITLCNDEHLALNLEKNNASTIQLVWNNECQAVNNTISVDASYNRIHSIMIDKRIKLQEISLQFNQLSSILGVTNFKNLTHLNLSHNAISEVPFDLLKNLTDLKYLDMSSNNLSALDVSHINSTLPNLEALYISNNNFSCLNQIKINKVLNTWKIGTDLEACELPIVDDDDYETEGTTLLPDLVSNSTSIDSLQGFIHSYGFYIISGLLAAIIILSIIVIFMATECRRRQELHVSHM